MKLLNRIWLSLPTVIRAFVVAMLIQVAGVLSFGVLAQLNLEVFPAIPWVLPVEGLILWVMYQFLGGNWGPASSATVRRKRLRARPIPKGQGPASLFTGIALGIGILFQVVLAYRLVAMEEAAGGALLQFLSAPPLTAAGILLAGVLMTGFVEEAAFRGYMQQPLEERHGPTLAILIVSIAFAGIHMPPLIVLPLFVFGALGWGIYARLSRSTLPGMVVHAAVDAVAFAWLFFRPEALPKILTMSALDNGMDGATWFAAAGSVVFAALTVVGFYWMSRVARGSSYKGSGRLPLAAEAAG